GEHLEGAALEGVVLDEIGATRRDGGDAVTQALQVYTTGTVEQCATKRGCTSEQSLTEPDAPPVQTSPRPAQDALRFEALAVQSGRKGDVGIQPAGRAGCVVRDVQLDRKSTRLNSSHVKISYAVFCLKKKKKTIENIR